MNVKAEISLSKMYHARQQFKVPPPLIVEKAVQEAWEKRQIKNLNGAKIAVCVGSRGIAGIDGIVARVVDLLKSVHARPFIVPAMGSHGGATARGQRTVLAHLGVTPENCGAPVVADMDVVSLGETDGIPLYLSRPAHEADGLVLINRVKPHTDFTGPVESGIHKMLVIGLGNRKGADFYHKMAIRRGFYDMIITAGRALLGKTKFLFGVAVVENQYHEICALEMAGPDKLEETEKRLLKLARTCLPGLPLDEIDLLIVDEMGKNFSGGGLDPNVMGFSSCRWGIRYPRPDISRIFVRGLSSASQGNGSGIGMVDVATRKLVDAIDWDATAVNARTACCPEDCKVPLTVETEKEAVMMALDTIAPHTAEDVKIVHIKNTLELDSLYLSRGCLSHTHPEIRLEIDPVPLTLAFNARGDMDYR